MKLGVTTVMMVEGPVFDGTGRKLPPVEAIEMIADAGFEGIELGISDSYSLSPAVAEREAERIGQHCRDRGLDIISVSTGARVNDPAAVRRKLEIASRLKAPAVRVDLTPYDADLSYHEQIKQNAEDFARALDAARPYRLKLLIELHFGALCPSASLAQHFLSPFDPKAAGAILDPANMMIEGYVEWKISVELLGDYLAHVHVKNVEYVWGDVGGTGHKLDRKQWSWQFATLDRGLVDWGRVIAALRGGGYHGWLSLEDFSNRPLKQKLKEGHAILSDQLVTA